MRGACNSICFVGRMIRHFFRRLFPAAASVVLANGCCNIMERSEGTYTTMGMECGSPYFCAKRPYYCTVEVAKDCLAAPYRLLADDYVDWGGAFWGAFATLTYPFWIADEACEIALDTVFLPCDIYAASRKGRGRNEMLETRRLEPQPQTGAALAADDSAQQALGKTREEADAFLDPVPPE